MTKFSFANLLGGGQRARAAAEDDEDKSENQDEEMAEDQEEETAEDQEDDGENTDDEARRAVLAERGRIAAILAAATPSTVAQAAYFATQTDMTPAQAKKALAMAPKASGGLSDAMRGRGGKPAPAAGTDRTAGNLPPELAAAQARRMSKER